MRKYIYLFILLCNFLFAETEEFLEDFSASKADRVYDKQENHFLTSTDYRITPKVNPITGEYCEEEVDLIVAGIQPLSVRRFYNHFAPYDPRYASWRYNPESFLVANFEWKGQEIFAAIGDTDGSMCSFKRSGNNLFSFQIPTGFTKPNPDGQSHPLNTKITYKKRGDPKDKHRYEYLVTITDGSGRVRHFKSAMHRWTHSVSWRKKRGNWLGGSNELWDILPNTWTPYHIPVLEEKLPNGNILVYAPYQEWKAEKKNYPRPRLINKITAYNSDKTKVLGSIQFRYPRSKEEVKEIKIEGSDAREAHIKHASIDPILLASAERPDQPSIKYGYTSRSLLSVEKPEGRILKTEYQKGTRKVSAQYAPVGPNGEMCPIGRYEYNDQHTIVYDAEDNKTIYCYDKHKQFTGIEIFEGETLYRTDRFFWDPSTGNLLEKIINVGFYNPLLITKYAYDKNQNLIVESKGNGQQWRTIHRTFSDDGFNLKLSETDREGKFTCYTYAPQTNLLASEIVYEGRIIRKRTFYFYDDCAVCIKTIVDDGQTADPYDLTTVTYRKITQIAPRQQLPCFGLPEIIEEKTIDRSGNEILLKKTIYAYHPSGKILEEHHYDANNIHCYSIFNTYDEQERLTSRTDPCGHTTRFTYDQNNNLISITGPRPDQHREITYDKANRPIRIAEWQTDGSILIIEKKYDKLGRVIEEIDACKNRTCYNHDALGRVTAIYHPDGAVESKEYDVLGNIIKETDSEGYETRKVYNLFSQPLSIYHPDGSEEHFTYYPTGTLRSYTDKNGATTQYTYDIFDHPIRADTYSSSGKLLKTISSTWSAFNKLSETEGDRTTHYTYDYAGRKINEQTAYQTIHYYYDALGRLSTIEEGDTTLVEEHDANDRVIQKRKEKSGTLQTLENYRYDQAGNQTHIIHSTGTTETLFNTYGKSLSIKDPLGFTTHFSYAYQNQLIQTTTNPKGTQTLSIHDCRNREAKHIKKNRKGEIIQQYENSYDKNGNRTQLTHTLFLGNRPIKSITHQWKYGPGGRLEGFIEAGEKQTHYLYDAKGRIQTIIKPDGCTLTHEYDELGRLSRYFSHDYEYHYIYDIHNQVTAVYDKTTDRTTTRRYDPLGHILQETLANDLTLTHTYDNQGRRTTLTLPDISTIHYTYDGMYLRTISRGSYTHTYSQRDLLGEIVQAHLPAQAGEVYITRDPLSRYTDYITPYYRANYQNGYDPNGNLVHYHYHDPLGEIDSNYSYDELDQLIMEKEHTYLFDSLNNRLKKDHHNHEVNSLCQITSDGQTHYTYDACGNLISDGVRKYGYDSLDRLISIEKEDIRIEYTYDPFHRRLAKIVLKNGVKVQSIRYLWDGNNEIGTVDEQGQINQLRILGEGLGAEIGAAVLYELESKPYIPIHDHRGCVVVLVDLTTNEPIECYRYSAFGEELTEDTLSPWRFSSKRVEEETKLIFFGRRYYHPELGRWITRDPEGFENGPNLYAYVSNSPLLRLDLYGLKEYLQNRYSEFTRSPFNMPSYPLLFEPGGQSRFGTFETGFSSKSVATSLRSLGYPDLPDLPNERGIGFINGADNTLEEAMVHLTKISRLAGGYNIDFAYNGNHGKLFDYIECLFNFRGHSTDPSIALRQMLDNFFDNKSSTAIYELFCTSQGAIHTKNTLNEYPMERRNRIRVIGISPGAYIPDDICHSVQNYESAWHRDLVPYLDIVGRRKYRHTIEVVPSHPKAPLHDHSFSSPTYEMYIKREIERYYKMTETK